MFVSINHKDMYLNYFAIPGCKNPNKNVNLNFIRETVLKHYNITMEDLNGKRRHHHIVRARAIYCYLASKKTELSLKQIGKSINRDHSAVIYYRNLIQNAYFTNNTIVTKPLAQIKWKIEH